MLAQCRLLDPTLLSSEEKLQLFYRWGTQLQRRGAGRNQNDRTRNQACGPPANLALSLGSCKGSLGDFPGGPVVKNLPCNTGDMGLILGANKSTYHDY